MNEKIATRWLPVPLTAAEIQQRGSLLASLLGDKDKVVQEAKDSATSYRSRISKLEVKINDVKIEVNEKRAHRDVEVRLVANIQDRVFEVRRMDDDSVVDLEDMTPSQFQELLNRPIPFEDDSELVEKEIASTYDSDPFAPDEAEQYTPHAPDEWILLEHKRPDPDTLVETGLYSEDTEQVESCLMHGYVSADADVAWNKFTDFHTLPTDPGEPRFEEWDITHWRHIQTDTDAPTEEGETN